MDVGGWRSEFGRVKVGGWRLEVGGWRLESGGWKAEPLDHPWIFPPYLGEWATAKK